MKKLEGKVAVITGGNSGIGLATAQRFVEEGAYVFITGRRQSELDAAVKQIGKNVTGVQGDVSNLADLDRLYATVKEQKGRHRYPLCQRRRYRIRTIIGSITESHFDKIFNINVKGLLFTVQKALPLFQDGGGSIILTASIGASKGIRGVECLQCNQGRYTIVRAHLDGRAETPQDPCQRHQSWSDRHTVPQQAGTE